MAKDRHKQENKIENKQLFKYEEITFFHTLSAGGYIELMPTYLIIIFVLFCITYSHICYSRKYRRRCAMEKAGAHT
jgi:hypothetical protein